MYRPSILTLTFFMLLASLLAVCLTMPDWSTYVRERSSHPRRHPSLTFLTSGRTSQLSKRQVLSYDTPLSDDSQYHELTDESQCCGLGFRSQWIKLGRRHMLNTYCSEGLICCDGLEEREVSLWAGFGLTLCVESEESMEGKRRGKAQLNPFTRYLQYYSDDEDPTTLQRK